MFYCAASATESEKLTTHTSEQKAQRCDLQARRPRVGTSSTIPEVPTKQAAEFSLWSVPNHQEKRRYLPVACRPIMGGVVNVSHNLLRHIPIDLECEEFPWDTFENEEYNTQELREWFPQPADAHFASDQRRSEGPETDREDIIEKENPVEKNDIELKKEQYYFMERIVAHRSKYGYRFLVKWQGFSHEHDTWEPVKCFILGGGAVNDVFESYCKENNPKDVLFAGKRPSSRFQRK